MQNYVWRFWRVWAVGMIFAVVVALGMRLPLLGHLPDGLNRDEAALGYNAYSLFKTGRDEWGKSWPVSITSFGDQKLPGYVYTLIPLVGVLGLETWVVRLPSFVSGLVSLIVMGYIAVVVAASWRLSQWQQMMWSWLVMVFMAISPWQLHFSLVAYEAHEAMALMMVGSAALLTALTLGSPRQQRWLLPMTALTWSLALLTYHSYQIFLPLMALGVLLSQSQALLRMPKSSLVVSIGIGATVAMVLLAGGVLQANAVKSRGISPFSTSKLLQQATLFRQVWDGPAFLGKGLFNKGSEGVTVFAQNYLKSFSGEFFFVHGSNHGDHNPGNGNLVHVFIAPLCILGILFAWEKRQYFTAKYALWWFLAALIPASLTIQSTHEIRMAAVFPIMEFLAAAGMVYLLSLITVRSLRVIAVVVLSVVMVLSAVRINLAYTRLYPQTVLANQRYHILADALGRYHALGIPEITQSVSSSPYIWYLFANKIDPAWAQANIVRYPATEEGFVHVKSIDTVQFETISWDEIAVMAAQQPVLLFLKPTEIADQQRVDSRFHLLETLKDSQGTTWYEVWRYSLE